MKTLLLLALILLAQFSYAGNYHDTMKSNIDKLQKSNSIEEINQLAALFIRIANAEEDEWLPNYYSSYAYARSTHFMSDADSIDMALDQSQEILDKLLTTRDDESEIHVLQAMIYSLRITSPSRGYKYSSLSNKSLDKAQQISANNPRIYYCRANNIFHTPKMFGGGANKALPLYQKAKALFNKQTKENELYPSWGHHHNGIMLDKCLAQK